jgi:hypothetical protein
MDGGNGRESLGRLRRWLRADGTVEGMVVLDTCLFDWRLSAGPICSPDRFTESG